MKNTLKINLCNSWELDPVRNYYSTAEVKRIYLNIILAKIFEQYTGQTQIEITFEDNHFSNLIYLDFELLISILRSKFEKITLYSDNPLDCNTGMFNYKKTQGVFYTDRTFILKTEESKLTIEKPLHKFGICIQRPDQHRLSLLVELSKYSNLDLFSKIGFDENTLAVTDYWRQSCGDQILRHYDIPYSEFCNVLKTYNRSELTDFMNPCVLGHEMQAIEQNFNNIKFLVDIVGESHVADGVFIPSEKTLRPMMMKQCFVIFSSLEYYKNLHKLGFKTFNEFWDESWDDIDQFNMFEKSEKIAKTINTISSNYTIDELMDKTKSIREHNYQQCIKIYHSDVWEKYIQKVIDG
jgi:hypothetical protein